MNGEELQGCHEDLQGSQLILRVWRRAGRMETQPVATLLERGRAGAELFSPHSEGNTQNEMEEDEEEEGIVFPTLKMRKREE
ncbi:hypothetical protein DPEC_G00034500 [Dallia pectoralis]|uniref:Uncharacterized protein n=1 Tax=Dallia pectoralis TaxID=75939 RepID=A0ACC2HD25_DALPE|nr:hypothetical protein DPEC_G00034500 [Dallia pectoralis]